MLMLRKIKGGFQVYQEVQIFTHAQKFSKTIMGIVRNSSGEFLAEPVNGKKEKFTELEDAVNYIWKNCRILEN